MSGQATTVVMEKKRSENGCCCRNGMWNCVSTLALMVGIAALVTAILLNRKNESAIGELEEQNEQDIRNLRYEDNYRNDELKRDIRTLNYKYNRVSSTINRVEYNIEYYLKRGYLGSRGECIPFNGYKYEGRYYRTTWEEARRICKNQGGDLPVHGMRELRTRRLIFDWLDFSRGGFMPLWIGLSKDENGTWRWVNGEPATDETTFWGEDPLSTPSNDSCAVLSKEGFFTLTRNCSSTDVLLTCEIPARF